MPPDEAEQQKTLSSPLGSSDTHRLMEAATAAVSAYRSGVACSSGENYRWFVPERLVRIALSQYSVQSQLGGGRAH